MKVPQPIPYQGSKRLLAPLITKYFPERMERLIEPFAGSAAVSIYTAKKFKSTKFLLNDINKPLINLLRDIIFNPHILSDKYELLWNEQIGNEKEYFINIRNEFNKNQQSHYLLYLMARCIKGAIRYNSNGEFNQSSDNRRKGKNPITMRKEILEISSYLKYRTELFSTDYSKIFKLATKTDLIYMDPPYQGTSKTKDPRYYSGIDFTKFINDMEYLNHFDKPFILSYDGKTGCKIYGKELPKSLMLHKISVEVGRSTQSTLLGGREITFESLYLSDSLAQLLPNSVPDHISIRPKQLSLL